MHTKHRAPHFNTDAGDPVGIYKTVFESEDGLHKAVIYFRVTF